MYDKYKKITGNKIEFVEYTHDYAEKVAEMWHKSKKGWNGEILHETAESVIKQESNSSHLKLWLALDGDKVVGYCKISKFVAEDALYLDYLNVRDDYHGKKIGKALVLICVDETIKRGFPRLDLYTWDGNLEAVPLYKKCGFFWEKDERSTHFLNFIPSVLNNEILKKYLKDFDWYKDSTRKLEIIPDGIEENKFEYLRYLWKRDNKQVEADYSRYGRGLRRIKTDDFEISMKIENRDLVFDNSYEVSYEIKNISGKALSIKLNGKSNKNVKFEFSDKFEVKDEKIVTAKFFVEKVEEELSKNEILPNVESAVEINGMKTKFAIGFFPQFPVKVNFKKRKHILRKDISEILEIELENRSKETIDFEFKYPKIEGLNFKEEKFKQTLETEAKNSFEVEISLDKPIFFDEEIEFSVLKEDKSCTTFKQRIRQIFPIHDDVIVGELNDRYVAFNGSQYVEIFKKESDKNMIDIWDSSHTCLAWFYAPALGNPFSKEFNQNIADKIELKFDNKDLIIKKSFISKDFSGIKLELNVIITSSGFVHRNWKVANIGDKTYNELKLRDLFNIINSRVIPYKDKYLELPAVRDLDLEFIEPEKMQENWIYGEKYGVNCGLYWDKDLKINTNDWNNTIIFDASGIKPGEVRKFKSVSAVMNKFRNWQDFRSFVTNDSSKKELTPFVDLEINSQNPVVSNDVEVELLAENKKNPEAKILIENNNQTKIESISKMKKLKLPLKETTVFDFSLNYESIEEKRKRIVFKEEKGDISQKIERIENMDVHIVNNGIVEFKAAEKFAPCIYSMRFKEDEHLDTGFPKICPKSWENPWSGGMSIKLNHLKLAVLIKEKYEIEFCAKEDNFGNHWKGIQITTSFVENEKLKGCELKEFFLTLPNQPFVIAYYEFKNNTGKTRNFDFNNRLYNFLGDDVKKTVINSEKINCYPGGDIRYSQFKDRLSYTHSDNKSRMLQFPLAKEVEYYSYNMMNAEYNFAGITHNLKKIDNSNIVKNPISLILFDDKDHDLEEVKGFNNIGFK